MVPLGRSSPASDKDKCKAKDANGDGEIGPGETQDCGGDVVGVGGNDGAHLPPAHEDANTHQWHLNGEALHWTKQSTEERKIIIRDSVSDNSYDTKLGNVLSDWGASSKFRFVRQSAETDPTTRLNCPMPTNYGRVRVCSHGDYTFANAGLASVRFNDNGHLLRGRVRVKHSVVDSSRRPLLCQEVGHTLGLDHRSTTGSCMHQNADAASSTPDSHDYEQLVNQTHHHGGESETGGALSDLDTGGGVLDGCGSFACFDGNSHGWVSEIVRVRRFRNGGGSVTIGFSYIDARAMFLRHKLL